MIKNKSLMNINSFSYIQHKLIPTALIALNMAFVQLLYFFSKVDLNYTLYMTVICIALLTIGILFANKYLLMGGIIFYSTLVLGFIFL